MKDFKNNYKQILGSWLVAVLIVVGGMQAFALSPTETLSEIKPLIHRGAAEQPIRGALIVGGGGLSVPLLGANVLLQQAGATKLALFDVPTNSVSSSVVVLNNALFAKDILVNSIAKTGGEFPWEVDYNAGTVSLSTTPEVVVGSKILATNLVNTPGGRYVCVEDDGTITLCASPNDAVCKTYTGASVNQPATDDATGCDTGTYVDATDDSQYFKWTCQGLNGGASASCQSDKPSIVGQCKTYTGTHATQPATDTPSACNPFGSTYYGTYSDTPDDTQFWRWDCLGTNGASDASCTANKPPAAGVCTSYPGSYTSEPATDTPTGCTTGTFNDVTDTTTQWRWECLGDNGGATTSCQASVTTVNGACQTYSGEHTAQPGTNTATGCTAGTYSDAAESGGYWRWNCNGAGAGTDASCQAAQDVASCQVYGSTNFSSQPATDDATGCVEGTYYDTTDTITYAGGGVDRYLSHFKWECRKGIPGIPNAQCQAWDEVINGACASHPGTHTSQPATNTATGCTAGTYRDISDTGTDFQWECVGQNIGSTNASCSATIQTSTPICTGPYCLYYCPGQNPFPGAPAWQPVLTGTAEEANAPTPYNCALGTVAPGLSTGIPNCTSSSPSGICSDPFGSLPVYDAGRYFCGEDAGGGAINIYNTTNPPGGPAALTTAQCYN